MGVFYTVMMTLKQLPLMIYLAFLSCLVPVYAADIGFFRIKFEPHYMTPNEQGAPRGIVDELVYNIFEDSEHRILPTYLPQRRRDLGLNSQHHSVWISISTLKVFTSLRHYFPEGAQASIPWFLFECIVVSPKHRPLDLSNITNSRLGFIYMPKPFWDNQLLNKKYHYELVPNTQSGLKMLLTGRIDAMFSFNTIINWNINAIEKKSSDFDFQTCPFWKNDQLIFIINEAQSSSIRKLINKRIQEFKDNGLIDEIVNRYTPKT